MNTIIYSCLGVVSLSILIAVGFVFIYGPNHKHSWITDIPIAHRGIFDNNAGIPENSMAAFKAAVQLGYAIELDVWLSNDNEVIVFHDVNLERMTGHKGNLEELSAQNLKLISLLKTQETIPTLRQVLTMIRGRVPVYIEIKATEFRLAGGLEEEVAKLLDDYTAQYKTDLFAVISFNPKSIEWFRQNRPNFVRGQSYDPIDTKAETAMAQFSQYVSWMMSSNPDFIVYDHEVVKPVVQKALGFLLPLISYNVNSEEQKNHAIIYADNVIFETIRPRGYSVPVA